MKKLLARIAVLALLLAVACFAQACADDLSFGKTQIAHGESVVITYDLSGYTFDAAELVPIADFNHSNSPRQARYELDKIPLTGKTGSVTFTQTSIGDRIGFQICLRTSDGSPDWREWPESDFFYGGDITFTDAWNTPVPPAMAVQYHQASVPARTPISADYQITPGSSPIDCLEVGWAVYDDQGFAASVLNPEDAPLSGTVVMEDPTWKATHYVMASLQTADGWIYDMEDGDTGIEVTTDATGSPLSIELSWKDENGRTLDWNTDRPVSGQLLLMSYRLRGGYTAYDGYVSLIPVSGSTDFGAKGYAGEARTMDFHIFGTTDLVLDLEYSDGRSSQTLQVTVPAPAVPPLQLTAGRDPNIYLGMPVYYGGLGADASLTHGAIECLWVEIQQYSVLQNAYGGEPRWSYSVPANAPFTVTETATWENSFNLWPSMDLPSAPMDVPVTFTCSWGGETASATVTMHYVNLPNGIAPTDNDYPTAVHLKVGDTFTIAPDPVPAGWSIPGWPHHVVVFDEQMSAFATPDAKNRTSQTKVFTANKAGTFPAAVMIAADTVYMGHNVVFYVADASGHVPAPVLELNSWYGPELDYFIGDGLVLSGEQVIGRPFSNPVIGYFGILNDTAYASFLQGDPVYTVTCNSPSIQFDVEPSGRWDRLLKLKSVPTSGQDVTFHIACDWDGAHGETDLRVRFIRIDMPTGLYREADQQTPPASLTVKTCDSLWAIDGLHLANDQVADDPANGVVYDRGMWYNDGDENAEIPFSVFTDQGRIAGTPGTYDIVLSASSANITWSENCRLVIQDRPFLTLPDSVTSIGSEAFTGTAAEVIVIPAGCKTIAADAFNGCPALACIINHSSVPVRAPGGVAVINR